MNIPDLVRKITITESGKVFAREITNDEFLHSGVDRLIDEFVDAIKTKTTAVVEVAGITLEDVRKDLFVLGECAGHEFDPSESLQTQLHGLYGKKDPYDKKRLILEALLAVEDAINWVD